MGNVGKANGYQYIRNFLYTPDTLAGCIGNTESVQAFPYLVGTEKLYPKLTTSWDPGVGDFVSDPLHTSYYYDFVLLFILLNFILLLWHERITFHPPLRTSYYYFILLQGMQQWQTPSLGHFTVKLLARGVPSGATRIFFAGAASAAAFGWSAAAGCAGPPAGLMLDCSVAA